MATEKSLTYGRVNKIVPKYRIVLLLLFVLNPFVSCCLSVYLLAKSKERLISTIIIILFFGLLGYTFLPFWNMDITRHYIMFNRVKMADSFSDFVLYESLSKKPDFFLDYLYWLLGKRIDTHQVVGFLGATFYYGFMIGVIYYWQLSLKQLYNHKVFFSLFFMFLALIPVSEFSGMRQGNAIMLFLFIISIPEIKLKKTMRAFFLILPCMLHFSLYPIVMLYLCTYFLNRKGVFVLSFCLIVSFIFFIPLMSLLMNFCLSLGGIGNGIAMKINDYIFPEEIETKSLYSGSVIRFVVILILVFFYPFIALVINRKVDKDLSIKRFHYFFILFFSYLIFSSSSYILSRNLMLFKFLISMYIVYGLFSCQLKWNMKRFLLCLFLLIIMSGPFSFFLGKEYRTLNSSLFTSNLFELINIETNREGYNIQ